MTVRILVGDAIAMLKTLPDESVQTCVTSPPYWGLRDYGVGGQIGMERTPDEYVAKMVAVFAEVRRVLRKDGTLWLNLGDSYVAAPKGPNGDEKSTLTPSGVRHQRVKSPATKQATNRGADFEGSHRRDFGLRPKNLIMIPARVALALQADGWYLRRDIIWHKPNPMPESVTDRPTSAHEYVFLLSKSERYFYDADAIAEPVTLSTVERVSQPSLDEQEGSARANGGGKTNGNMKAVVKRSGNKERKYGDTVGKPTDSRSHQGRSIPWEGTTRNARSVWSITTKPFKGAHFAVMPRELAEKCILAGSPAGGVVLDPFGGAGTTGVAAAGHYRHAILIELNPDYAILATQRVMDEAPLFAEVVNG